jgi:hypothetical protein
MDPWKEFAAWVECRDAVRTWAELEAKSPQMADDLVQQYAEPTVRPRNWRLGLAFAIRFAAWIVESWWQITRR